MELILLEKISGLGNLGDKVTVKPGHARNFLIPQGKAVRLTTENLEKFEKQRAEWEKIAQGKLSEAQKRADDIKKLNIVIPASVSEEGKLYGSVGTRDIAQAITNLGVKIEKSEILLPHGAFRFVGEYDVILHLHSDVELTVKISIVPQN